MGPNTFKTRAVAAATEIRERVILTTSRDATGVQVSHVLGVLRLSCRWSGYRHGQPPSRRRLAANLSVSQRDCGRPA